MSSYLNDALLRKRFWAKVQKGNGCWLFMGSRYKEPFDYGRFKVVDHNECAHRFAWKLVNGPIPAGMKVLHRCDNPPCVRPDHLFLGTQADNMRDAASKGRLRTSIPASIPESVGEKNGQAKLTEEQVLDILASSESQYELAKIFGSDSSSRFVNGVLGTLLSQQVIPPRRRKKGKQQVEGAAG